MLAALGHGLQVRSSAKGALARACYDANELFAVAGEIIERSLQFMMHPTVDGIHYLWAVQGHCGHAIGLVDGDELHGSSP